MTFAAIPVPGQGAEDVVVATSGPHEGSVFTGTEDGAIFRISHDGRTVEAQQIWSAITSASRYWGLISRDFPTGGAAHRELVHRHLAWLTALRYELRDTGGLDLPGWKADSAP